MNSVYMTLVAIFIGIAVALSINSVSTAQGVSLSIVIYIGFLALKIFLDDIAHFKRNTNHNVISNGFMISVLLWLLFGIALSTVSSDVNRASFYLIIINLLGIVWLALNYLGVAESDPKDRLRRVWWIFINSFHVISISSFLVFHGNPVEEAWKVLFYGLSLVVTIDAIALGTFPRLTKAFEAQSDTKS